MTSDARYLAGLGAWLAAGPCAWAMGQDVPSTLWLAGLMGLIAGTAPMRALGSLRRRS